MYYILIALLSGGYLRLKVDANCSDMIRSLINIMRGSTEIAILVIRIRIRIVIAFFLTINFQKLICMIILFSKYFPLSMFTYFTK